MSLLPSAFVLGIAALVAASLARSRRSPAALRAERAAAARALAVALVVQGVHFGEEAATGFHARFPAVFGQPEIPFAVFVGFNVAWLVAWLASVPGLRAARRDAFFAAWFLAIAGVGNGIAHPLLALAAGEYFPGLVTAPVVAVVSARLAFRLMAATRSRSAVGSVDATGC